MAAHRQVCGHTCVRPYLAAHRRMRNHRRTDPDAVNRAVGLAPDHASERQLA
ncbi:hypothetical protein BZL30_2724 [Mycobacterium kansasii]|uniref:Uncharacterized protein n=1 Tax=Mycobacterium kansasii TaxID=1768 RepID=A0A1V3XKV6_MYCKA|nr:hypothetical protein BZL30_2724 [Mycobacterium kansasii]